MPFRQVAHVDAHVLHGLALQSHHDERWNDDVFGVLEVCRAPKLLADEGDHSTEIHANVCDIQVDWYGRHSSFPRTSPVTHEFSRTGKGSCNTEGWVCTKRDAG